MVAEIFGCEYFLLKFCLIGKEIHLAKHSKLEQEQDQKGHKLM